MSLNAVPGAERLHIGFFGNRNAGKSSLVNRVTEQELAVVSDKKGTTTDPVRKSMELLPLGPVVIIDTPGFDDSGSLGDLRVRKTKEILNQTDIAVLVIDGSRGITASDRELAGIIRMKKIPLVICVNKSELLEGHETEKEEELLKILFPAEEEQAANSMPKVIFVSAMKGTNIFELKEMIGREGKEAAEKPSMLDGIVKRGDRVVLVIPIDSSAPKARLILPQQMVIHDLLIKGAEAVCVKDTELEGCLARMYGEPDLVITDSQVFGKVAKLVPEQVPLTSFSILMARYKGLLTYACLSVTALDRLKDGSRVLISEGCTHHRMCDDIGSFKLPNWVRRYAKCEPEFMLSSGHGFTEEPEQYAAIIHCGGCMLNEREMRFRMKQAEDAGVPMTNYGIAIAYMNGILRRSTAMLPEIRGIFEK